ncbi:MAG: PEP-CTERM sorting domain-containing protein [Terriglobales bacterium]
MKRITIILGLLALLLPMAAWADGIDLTNQGGTITFTDAGVVSAGSELMSFNGIQAPRGHSLGSVSFSTGAFTGASLWTGGTFSSVGSSFIIKGVGNFGQPKGVIFDGAFFGPISWTVISHSGASYVFDLSGKISGMLWTGREVSGTTSQTIYAYTDQWPTDHKGGIHLGQSQLTVPEPGTLGLLGTGLMAIAGTVRRKLMKS